MYEVRGKDCLSQSLKYDKIYKLYEVRGTFRRENKDPEIWKEKTEKLLGHENHLQIMREESGGCDVQCFYGR